MLSAFAPVIKTPFQNVIFSLTTLQQTNNPCSSPSICLDRLPLKSMHSTNRLPKAMPSRSLQLEINTNRGVTLKRILEVKSTPK